jgi:predicted transcriptional regulator
MTKNEFKAKANETIDEVSAKIDELKAKKDDLTDDLKESYYEIIADLEAQKTNLKIVLSDLENAADAKWEEAKETLNSVSYSFNEGIEKLKSLF